MKQSISVFDLIDQESVSTEDEVILPCINVRHMRDCFTGECRQHSPCFVCHAIDAATCLIKREAALRRMLEVNKGLQVTLLAVVRDRLTVETHVAKDAALEGDDTSLRRFAELRRLYRNLLAAIG